MTIRGHEYCLFIHPHIHTASEIHMCETLCKTALNECDTAFSVLFIGRDHGITPQADRACLDAWISVRQAMVVLSPSETWAAGLRSLQTSRDKLSPGEPYAELQQAYEMIPDLVQAARSALYLIRNSSVEVDKVVAAELRRVTSTMKKLGY